MSSHVERQLQQLDHRMARIESRLCQLMYHLGLDPNVRLYDEPRVTCPLEEYAASHPKENA